MKVAPERVAPLLADPSGVDAVVLHGDDAGLVRERADAAVRAVLGLAPDPFRLAELDDARRLVEEARARSLTGGRRVIRVRGVGAAWAEPLAAALAGPVEALIVLEAGVLAPRLKLRLLAESSPRVACIECRPDDPATLAGTIRDGLAREGVAASADVVAWLADRLGEDRGVTRQEIAKLALSVGRGGSLERGDAEALLGETGGASLDAAMAAALAGDPSAADEALDRAMADGEHPVAVVRAAIRALQRLDLAASEVADGQDPVGAAEAARVWRAERPAFLRALRRWPPADVAAALAKATAAERACKTTGAADFAIARQLVLGLALAPLSPGSAWR